MIIGIGTDIIEINRIEKAINRGLFLDRVFTEIEREYLDKKRAESAAGYFAAKEAVSKALGTGIKGFTFKDIEIQKNNGAPFVVLYGGAKDTAKKLGIKKIHLSISHSRDYATAVAVAEG